MTKFWKDSNNILRLVISILAATAMLFHLNKWGDVQFDNYSLILLAIAVVPWLSAFIQSLTVNKDGFDIKMREIEMKADAAKDAALLGTGGKDKSTSRLSKGSPNTTNPDDPQKGMWGGKSINNGRTLSAKVERIPDEDFYRRVIFRVESNDAAKPLNGKVTFYLHPTFKKSEITVPVTNGAAELSLVAWGAFTVGAEADNGQTKLELDLAKSNDDGKDPFFTR